ncbi:CLUMA_CG018590, isoform A [Clunio marinus]|uniref:CLUMA_CG018590, isoform A n=1 Tax=Clunio marinus TaxID=568069 RepID=A0A1J1J0Y2_9DIPT|nr:CLUMA_CG018590, isoform A [Clunio marinus]
MNILQGFPSHQNENISTLNRMISLNEKTTTLIILCNAVRNEGKGKQKNLFGHESIKWDEMVKKELKSCPMIRRILHLNLE